MVYIWYPAQRNRERTFGVYVPRAEQIDKSPEGHQQMIREFESVWPLVVSGAITSHALEAAPIASRPSKFPLILFLHGVGGSIFEYSSLIEELVSHGYVIAAVEDTYLAAAVAFADGRVMPHRLFPVTAGASPEERQKQMTAPEGPERTSVDLRFVLDKVSELNGTHGKSALAGRLDLARVAAMGHSAGGLAAIRACQLEPRFRACVSLDGVANPEGAWLNYADASCPDRPFLLLEPYRTPPTDERLARMGETRAQFDEYLARKQSQLKSCRADSYDAVVRATGMVHDSFGDGPLLSSANSSANSQVALHNLGLIEATTLAFLDKYLMGRSRELFNRSNASLPEVTVTAYGSAGQAPLGRP